MAVTIGKRKRRNDVDIREESASEDSDDLRTRFQRAFEAKFKPLKISPPPSKPGEVEEEDVAEQGEESDWSGFSEDAEDNVVVVDHARANSGNDEVRQHEVKAFMSSRPPSLSEKRAKVTSKQPKGDAEEDGNETANLKNDLALQRLLKESHLLDPSSFNSSNAAPEGKSRLKALDLRLQDLGAKKGTLEQERMPLSHRKGIKTKAATREATRRKDAAENGIILERVKATKAPERRREKGVDVPSVGKFKGGTLKLSSRDVKSIEGPRKSIGGKGRRS